MGLRLKFNLALGSSLLIMLVVVYYFHQQKIHMLDAMETEHQATLLYQLGESIRQYNQNEVVPLLEQLDAGFLPQSVGSYASTQILAELNNNLPQFSYKVAIIDAGVDLYRPNVWQNNLIEQFTSNPELPLYTQQLADAQGVFYAYAKPIVNAGNITGAKIVRIDLADQQSKSEQALLRFALLLSALWILTMVVLNVMLHVLIIKPLQQMAKQADQISQGQAEIDELEVHGQDEISQFGQAFNRLQRSLKAAMSMLS